MKTYNYITLTLALFFLMLIHPISAQFLTPDDTGKIQSPSETSTGPTAPAQPSPTFPVTGTSDGYFSDLAAYGRDKGVILTWHLVHGRTIDKRIQIYRFAEEPRVIHDISRGTLIAKLSGEINLYEDQPPSKGMYYYAVFVESSRGLEPASFNPSRNLVGPVAYQSSGKTPVRPARETGTPGTDAQRPEFASSELDNADLQAPDGESDDAARRGINGVIRRTFMRGDYDASVRSLKPFLRNKSARVRAKAMFYIGLSRYRLEQYDRAIKYFEHPLTLKYYRRNAEFWINRTSENLR